MTIETERLILRPFEERDASDVFEYLGMLKRNKVLPEPGETEKYEKNKQLSGEKSLWKLFLYVSVIMRIYMT